MSDFLPHPFWNFSLELYAGEGVAEACLDLQDRRGCDVNILLFCCWLGASGRPTLTADRLRTILAASDAWQSDIVKRLRAAVGNLGVYAVCLGVVPDEADRKSVAALMRATFPAFAPVEVAEAVGLAA